MKVGSEASASLSLCCNECRHKPRVLRRYLGIARGGEVEVCDTVLYCSYIAQVSHASWLADVRGFEVNPGNVI